MLARTPDAPAGVRGISLFIVPKFLVNADGTLGQRNDLRCVTLEHKLGIHASPTCVMAFGDNGGAMGYLVGEEGRGLAYMFTMMNIARLVGRRAGPGDRRARLSTGARPRHAAASSPRTTAAPTASRCRSSTTPMSGAC